MENQTENSTLNNEEQKPDKRKVIAIQEVLCQEIKKTEYYAVLLNDETKFLARDNKILLYHKNVYHKNEITGASNKAVDIAAEQANGVPMRADKALAKMNMQAGLVLIIGKLVKKSF